MNFNDTTQLLLIVGGLFAGGISAFLIIRVQLSNVLQVELKVYKDKVTRLEKDMKDITEQVQLYRTNNLALITERDYLRNLIISAITSKKDIHKELLDEMRKPINDTQLYDRGGEM